MKYPKRCQKECDGYNTIENVRILEERGYLSHVENEAGERSWVNYKDIEGGRG